MAKHPVEQSPKLNFSNLDFAKFGEYLSEYSIADKQGRYLHWSQLKWRVPSKEAEHIWYAVKFCRDQVRKSTGLFDKSGNEFSFCIHDSLEPKLHKIVQLGAGKVAAIAGSQASDNIQQNYLAKSAVNPRPMRAVI